MRIALFPPGSEVAAWCSLRISVLVLTVVIAAACYVITVAGRNWTPRI